MGSMALDLVLYSLDGAENLVGLNVMLCLRNSAKSYKNLILDAFSPTTTALLDTTIHTHLSSRNQVNTFHTVIELNTKQAFVPRRLLLCK